MSCKECETPEGVVVVKESDPQVFRDISIDGEDCLENKCCVANCELDHNNISSLLKHELSEGVMGISEDDQDQNGGKANAIDSSTSNEEEELNHRNGKKSIELENEKSRALMKEKMIGNAESEHPPKAENMKDKMDDVWKPSISCQGTEAQAIAENGNSRIFGAGNPYDKFTFSGLIPHSDAISLRSTSTTSTRSFAFPILAPEWNDSPVRMAEADGRFLRRSKTWRTCFSCCKF